MRNLLIIYALLIGYILLSNFVLSPSSLSFYNELVNPLIWVVICGISIYLSKDTSTRIKNETGKTQSLIIGLIIYFIIYFLLGLLFGYQNTPYSKDILSILKNIWAFGSIIFFQEIIREAMVKLEKKKIYNFVIITILLALINVSFTDITENFDNAKEAFIYTAKVLIPTFVTSGVMTYFVLIGGAKLSIIYRLFLTLPEFIVPIMPNFDWFVTSVVGVTVPLALFVYLNFEHIKKNERLSARDRKKYNPAMYIPVFAFIAVMAGFVIGVFKYQPVAVLSGSMSPTFNRGDAVVVRKLTRLEKKELQKNDIIQFTSGSKFVVHRIVDTENDEYGNILYVTKGDHNNTVDLDRVSAEQVVGKVSFTIPYIGYPSVWLSGVVS